MKISWETLLPLFITASAGILVWLVKLISTWAVRSIKKAIVKEVTEQIQEQETRIIGNRQQINQNTADIKFLIETLIKRNS